MNATAFQSAGMRRFHIIVTAVNDVNWNTVDVVVEKLMPIDTLYDPGSGPAKPSACSMQPWHWRRRMRDNV